MNNPFAFATEDRTQQSYRRQKPLRNDLRKYNAHEFLNWEQQNLQADGKNTHFALFFGLPNSGKTSLLGSFVHCIYTQSTLFCRYRDEVTTPQDDKLFYSLIEYFGDSGAVNRFEPTHPNQLFNLSFEFKVKQEEHILNLVDCSGELYKRFAVISEQQSTPFTPNRNEDGSLKYQIPTLRKSIFPDYITALLESPAQVHVYLVCNGETQPQEYVTAQDAMFVQIVKELSNFKNLTGKSVNISVVSSKIDLLYPDPFAEDQNVVSVHQTLSDVIPQTMKILSTNANYFYSGYLDSQNKKDFVIQQFNPTTKKMVDELFIKMTGSKIPHTSKLD